MAAKRTKKQFRTGGAGRSFVLYGSSMKVRDVIKRLEADGWYRIRSKSGHRQFKHGAKKGRVTVAAS
jgi:hypothetical protein